MVKNNLIDFCRNAINYRGFEGFQFLWLCILLQMKSLHPTQAHGTPFAVDINHLQVLLYHVKI